MLSKFDKIMTVLANLIMLGVIVVAVGNYNNPKAFSLGYIVLACVVFLWTTIYIIGKLKKRKQLAKFDTIITLLLIPLAIGLIILAVWDYINLRDVPLWFIKSFVFYVIFLAVCMVIKKIWTKTRGEQQDNGDEQKESEKDEQ